jgi:hypothetical protein
LHIHIKRLCTYEFPQIISIPVTETGVICTISPLKNKTSCGYDGLSNKILKLCGRHISIPVTYIYKQSLTCDICPNCVKYAIIKQCFRKGDISQVSKYRNVSLLTGFSKIFELLIIHRLKQHSVGNIILANEQFAFHDNFTTESAIFKFIESSFNAWNNKEYIIGILWNERVYVKWVKTLFYNRKQRVVLQFVSAPNLLSD